MNSARITICIPAYNRPEFLREALASLCDQGLERDDYVIAISDDASPTPLSPIISQFERKLRIVHHRNAINLGHIANFEKAFRLAQTRYISFLPHDDLIAPGQLGRALSALERDPAAVLVASLTVCQQYPGALDSRPHGAFLRGSSRASYAEPYVWDRTEWMALALTTTPLSIVGSVFHAETFTRCQQWKSFPVWHDRLMLGEMGLQGRVISLPWIGGYYRVSDSQLSSRLIVTNRNEFVDTSKLILHLCELANIPVIEFWIGHVCEAGSEERSLYLNMLNNALGGEVFENIKKECERRLKTRLHLGGRLARMGIPEPVAQVLRRIDRLITGRR